MCWRFFVFSSHRRVACRSRVFHRTYLQVSGVSARGDAVFLPHWRTPLSGWLTPSTPASSTISRGPERLSLSTDRLPTLLTTGLPQTILEHTCCLILSYYIWHDVCVLSFSSVEISLWGQLIKSRCPGTAAHPPLILKKTTFTGESWAYPALCHTCQPLGVVLCLLWMLNDVMYDFVTSFCPVFQTSRSTRTLRQQPWLLRWAATYLSWTACFWSSTLCSRTLRLSLLQVRTHFRPIKLIPNFTTDYLQIRVVCVKANSSSGT